jgi:P27 family predicted phage terminase small subunit
MGARGPAPKPTAIKKIQGNPGKRPLNENEPQLEPGIPECPDYLDAIARKEWARVSKLLLGMRVLTEADYIALGSLCQSYSTMMQAQRQLSKTGLLIQTKTGYPIQNPLLSIIAQEKNVINKLMCEFGLTPASRTRVNVVIEGKKTVNKFSKFAFLDDVEPIQDPVQ